MKRFVPLALGLAFWLAAPPAQPVSNGFAFLFTGYVGTPTPPATPTSGGSYAATSGVVTVGGEGLVSVKIEDASGADGVGEVQIQSRDCATCGWYVQATCTDPPDKAVVAERCNYSLADAYQVKAVVTAYTSGTFQAAIRFKAAS